MSLTKVTSSMIVGGVTNILDFGADPTGVADSSAAFTAAIASFAATEVVYIEIPTGDYLISNKITINRSVIIKGTGGRLIANVANDYVFEIDDTEPSFPNDVELDNLQIKWAGGFGTSISGGIHVLNGIRVLISNCEFTGLGLNAIKITNMITGVIERNLFQEHLNNNEIMYVLSTVYLITIRDNFFQFTSPRELKPCLYMRQVFNADISNNAFQNGSYGAYLCQFGIMYGGSVRNNFFEGCVIGLSLGNDNGNGFFGSFRGVTVENNVFTGNGTAILVAGNVNRTTICNNHFDGLTPKIGINVTSKGYNSLSIEGNSFLSDMTLANRIQGYAYPFGFSSVDATKVVVDRTDSTSGWTEAFDPSGQGTLSTATPMPGVNAAASLQLSYAGTPTDQYIVQKTISTTDLDNSDFFVVPFWVDDPEKLKNVSTGDWRILGIGPDSSNYWGFDIGKWSDHRTIVINSGWNIMLFPKTDAVIVVGTPASWSAITYVQLRIVPVSTAVSPVVRFGGIFGFRLNGTSEFAGSQIL